MSGVPWAAIAIVLVLQAMPLLTELVSVKDGLLSPRLLVNHLVLH